MCQLAVDFMGDVKPVAADFSMQDVRVNGSARCTLHGLHGIHKKDRIPVPRMPPHCA